MRTKSFFLIICAMPALFLTQAFGQVGINADNSEPNPAAMLDVKSSSKGLLPPRMTHAELNAIVDPPNGLIVYCTDCGPGGSGAMSLFMAGAWYNLSATCMNPLSPGTGTHIPLVNQIVWNWNVVAWAAGYKWNTLNDYGSATDMGTATTKTETGLTCNTSYVRYVWAYNSCGASVAASLTQSTSWECGCPITDSRDSKTYTTVLIGTQCWMAQDLNVGKRINGSQTDNDTIEKYCYGDIEANCDVYGGLYQWDEFMDYTASSSTNPSGRQGICPAGWHIPSDAEWTQLTDYLEGESVAGGRMKEAGTVHWASPNIGATNSSGFTALPAGLRFPDAYFNYLFTDAHIWSSTLGSSESAWLRNLSYASTGVSRYYYYRTVGHSGRCVRD